MEKNMQEYLGKYWGEKSYCESQGLALLDIKTYSKASIIETMWYWCMNRQTVQQNRIESPEINFGTYGKLIYNKGSISNQWGKD